MRSENLLPLLLALVCGCIGTQVVLVLLVTDAFRPLAYLFLQLIRGPAFSNSLLAACRDIAAQVIGTIVIIRFLPERWLRRQRPEA